MAKEALLRRLIREGFLAQVAKPNLHPDLQELFKSLSDAYFYVNIHGDDGGNWLYKINAENGQINISEEDIGDLDTQEYKDNHFILALPDWVIYDALLGEIPLEEALDHAAWGGSFASHPTWTFLKMSDMLGQFENLLDRQAIVRVVRGH
jgi:hypothetical protein